MIDLQFNEYNLHFCNGFSWLRFLLYSIHNLFNLLTQKFFFYLSKCDWNGVFFYKKQQKSVKNEMGQYIQNKRDWKNPEI